MSTPGLTHPVDRARAQVHVSHYPGLTSWVSWTCPLCPGLGAVRDFTPEHHQAALDSARRHMAGEHRYEPIPYFRPLPQPRPGRRPLGAVIDLSQVVKSATAA